MISLNKVTVNPNATKIDLRKKGDYSEINLEKFHAKITWKTAIDMDLHVFYMKKVTGVDKMIAYIKKYLLKIFPFMELLDRNHVYYGSKGMSTSYPYIRLDHDAGVGGRAGDNEENMSFSNLEPHGHILIAVNIFNKSFAKFCDFDCKAIVTSEGRDFVIPLDSKSSGSWAIIAKIDNTGTIPKIINMNKISWFKPIIERYI